MTSSSSVVINSFNDYWDMFGAFLPKLVVAIIILMVGFIFAWVFESLVNTLLKKIKIDSAVEKLGFKALFEKGGFKFSFSKFLSSLVYWFVLIAFLSSSIKVLEWDQISDFLADLVKYLPSVIAAVVILIIGLLVARALSHIVENSTKAAQIKSSHLLVGLTKWSIIVFSILAALVQLQIATRLIEILFTGLVIMIALAGGLAFGLGGKEHAKEWIERMKK